jgi:Gram-negative porin
MKSRVFPWVILGLLAVSQAAWAEMKISGRINASVDYTNDGSKSTPTHDATNLQLVSNKSRLAFSGNEELSPNVDLIWQFAAEFSADTGSFNGNTDNNDNTIESQDTFIGLDGSIGTFTGGYMGTPYRQSTDDLDIFKDTAADYSAIFGQNPNSSIDHDQRASNVLIYQTPSAKKLKGAVGYVLDENEDGINTPGLSMNVVYDNRALYMAFAYDSYRNSGVGGENDTGTRFGARWDFGQGTRIALIWESLDAGGNNNDREAYEFNISHLTGNATFKFAYILAGDVGGVSDTGAKNFSFGLFYALSRTTDWYGLYTQTNNGSQVGYGLETVPNGAIGGNVSALSFGLRHEFDNL